MTPSLREQLEHVAREVGDSAHRECDWGCGKSAERAVLELVPALVEHFERELSALRAINISLARQRDEYSRKGLIELGWFDSNVEQAVNEELTSFVKWMWDANEYHRDGEELLRRYRARSAKGGE